MNTFKTLGMRMSFAVLLAVTASGCGGNTSSPDDETIKLGMDSAFTGTIGSLGVQNRQGVQLFLDELNSNGGLLGQEVELVTRDNAADPALATTNVRELVTEEDVVPLMGPVSSATAVAGAGVASQLEIPVVETISNDISLSTDALTPYVFNFQMSSHMESFAVANYVLDRHSEGDLRIATIAPDYNQGRTTVAQFIERIGDAGEVVSEQYPELGAPDFSADIAAMVAEKPDVVFSVLSGNDLATWTKQAKSYGLFKDSDVVAPYVWNLLPVLKDQIPDSVSSYGRAPFFAIEKPGVEAFAEEYHEKYDEWPTDWSLLGYAGTQMWAAAVEKAGSTEPQAIRDALESVKVDTLLGEVGFRECDHLAPLPSYVGPLTDDLTEPYGFKTFEEVHVSDVEKTMLSCEEKLSMSGQ